MASFCCDRQSIPLRSSHESLSLSLSLSLSSLSLASTAHAANFVGINGSGCAYASIQDAIDNASANDILYVEHGPTVVSETLNIPIPLTFIAADDTGFCNSPGPWDTVKIEPLATGDHTATITTTGTVRFQGFAFLNASTSNVLSPGGAIQASGPDLELHQSTFSNNDGWCGGAVYLQDGTLAVTDTTMLNNEAQQGGAMCLVRSEATLGGGANIGAFPNRASDGGGNIYLSASELELTDNAVVQNGLPRGGVTPDGGCIMGVKSGATKSSITMRDDSIVRQCEGNLGGAILLDESDLAMHDDAVIENSHALKHGGLAYVLGTTRLWDRVRLSDGSADWEGGLLYLNGSASADTIDPVGIVFRDGQADENGGCINMPVGDLLLQGTVRVEGCTAKLNGGGIYLNKGAHYVQAQGAQVGSPTNLNRSQRRGGGIFSYGATLEIGGGVPWDVNISGEPIDGTRVDGNMAKEAGGGLYLTYDSILTTYGAVFQNNRAVTKPSEGFGGGLAVYDGSQAVLYDTVFFRNRAREKGGAIYVHDGRVEMTAIGILPGNQGEEDPCPAFDDAGWYCSEVRANEAGRPNAAGVGVGGGVYVENTGEAEFSHTGFTGNGADVSAPQIYAGGDGRIQLTNSGVFDADLVAWPATDGVVVDGTAELSATSCTFGGEATTIDYGPSTSGVFEGNVVWPDGGVGLGLLPNGLNAGDCNVGLGTPSLVGVDNVNLDPNFIATWRGYYRIDLNSPAFNHCSSPLASVPVIDMDFCSRPAITYPDAGAFEWHLGLCP